MSRTLTLHLPDNLFDSLDLQSRVAGVSIQDWALDVLSSRLATRSKLRDGSAESKEQLARLLAACGAIAVDDPESLNTPLDRNVAKS